MIARQRRAQIEIAAQPGVANQLPDLLLQDRQLQRIELLDGVVLVDEIVERRDRTVQIRVGHRRHQVIDDDRVGAPLGLAALARIVDDERIHERQIAEERVGKAVGGQPDALARQPLERPMLADVDDRVRAPPAVRTRRRQPAIERRVVMRRRKIGRVIDRVGIHPVAAWRLQRDERVSKLQRGEVIVGRVAPRLFGGPHGRRGPARSDLSIDARVRRRQRETAAGRQAPRRFHLRARRRRQPAEPLLVPLAREALRGAILERMPLVVGAAGQQIVHQRFGGRRQPRDAIASPAHRPQQVQQAGGSVEADGVADLRGFRRRVRQDERHSHVGAREMA